MTPLSPNPIGEGGPLPCCFRPADHRFPGKSHGCSFVMIRGVSNETDVLHEIVYVRFSDVI